MKTVLISTLALFSVALADPVVAPPRLKPFPSRNTTECPDGMLKVIPKGESSSLVFPSRTTRSDPGVRLNAVSFDADTVLFSVTTPSSKGTWRYKILGLTDLGKTNMHFEAHLENRSATEKNIFSRCPYNVTEEIFKAVSEWKVVSDFSSYLSYLPGSPSYSPSTASEPQRRVSLSYVYPPK
jgi:hypothetical protein